MSAQSLSKTQYLKGLQCPKALWFYRYRKDLAPEIDPETQIRFDTGHEIGELAKEYFGQGVEVLNPYWEISGTIDATQKFIKDGHDLIFEAMAQHPINGCYARIDILKRVEGSEEWDLIEVKSSTGVKDYHIDDVGFQYYVFHAAGYKLRSCFLMVIDNSYVRQGEIDPRQLLRLEDITSFVLAKQSEIEPLAEIFSSVLESDSDPDIPIGERCFTPFECDYRPHCWAHVPSYSVYDVFQKPRAEEIARLYGLRLEDLPDHIRPNGVKRLDLQSYLGGEIIIDQPSIQGFLKQLCYPLRFLDYETLMPAIPLFEGTRPYQQIPFQFSLHEQVHEDAELIHIEYLHKEQSDPRRTFAQRLIEACGQEGHIVVYNQAFERTRNKELANDFPEYADAIHAINERMIDLLVPFKNRWLYHPNQNSSASIKAVLPAFTALSYDNMEISHGGQAMLEYGAFMSGKLSSDALSSLWQNLTEYCKQDTYAMKVLLDVLKKYSKKKLV